MSKNISARRRTGALLSVAAMATTGLIATAGPAGAAITAGPDDGTTGFPQYFKDSNGLALQMCLDACTEAAEPGEEPAPAPDPNHAPYFSAMATAGKLDVAYELATDAEVEGQPGELVNMAAVRLVSNNDPLAANSRFRVQGPFGAFTFSTDGRGRPSTGAERLGHVSDFLRPLNPAGELLGDGHAFVRVTGSPTGFNRVVVSQIVRPGVQRELARTNRFALMGQKLADTAMTEVNLESVSLNARQVTKQIRYTNFGTADATPNVTIGGANPGRFSFTQSQATVGAGQSMLITVRYAQQLNRSHSAVLSISDNSLAQLPEQVALSGKGRDTLAPKVTARSPRIGARNVARGANVSVTFNEQVIGLQRGMTLVDSNTGRRVAAKVSRVGQTNRYVLNPRSALQRRTSYTVRLNGARTGLRDMSNNIARDSAWRFRTR